MTADSHDDAAEPRDDPLVLDEQQAERRLTELLERGPARVLLGLAGAPGVGKSTYADRLAAALPDAVVVGMDGFHLAQAALTRLGRADRKGAPDTFDAAGYVATLRRLRAATETVWAPQFRRDLEEPVAAAVPVRPATRVVLTEGNYLLLPQEPWAQARALCDEIWYLELPEAARVHRLIARHVRYGRGAAQARARATLGVDADNARLVAATRARADVVVRLSAADDEVG